MSITISSSMNDWILIVAHCQSLLVVLLWAWHDNGKRTVNADVCTTRYFNYYINSELQSNKTHRKLFFRLYIATESVIHLLHRVFRGALHTYSICASVGHSNGVAERQTINYIPFYSISNGVCIMWKKNQCDADTHTHTQTRTLKDNMETGIVFHFLLYLKY